MIKVRVYYKLRSGKRTTADVAADTDSGEQQARAISLATINAMWSGAADTLAAARATDVAYAEMQAAQAAIND